MSSRLKEIFSLTYMTRIQRKSSNIHFLSVPWVLKPKCRAIDWVVELVSNGMGREAFTL